MSSPVKSMGSYDLGLAFDCATGRAAGRFVGRLRAFALGGLNVELLEELGSASGVAMISSTSTLVKRSIICSVNDSHSDLKPVCTARTSSGFFNIVFAALPL